MKKLLYVSAHNPYPPVSGGQVDTWYRLKALAQLGVAVDLMVTVKQLPSAADQDMLRTVAEHLTFIVRRPLPLALLDRRPVQMAARASLRSINFASSKYAVALLDSEFVGEVLRNRTLQADRIIVRVQNDEAAYQCRLAAAEPRWFHRCYFRMEMRRMARYVPHLWRQVDDLWFISADELQAFRRAPNRQTEQPRGRFLPAGLSTECGLQPNLESRTVLFLGTLTVALNQDAIRWYLREVHPHLLRTAGYSLLVAGSTGGKDVEGFLREMRAHPAVEVRCDVGDLQALFRECGAFASPMRLGAGVKLKTVEAAMRGLPLVSTTVGAEGSGLLDGVHCSIADEPEAFASAVRSAIIDRPHAMRLRDAATNYIRQHYSQVNALRVALADTGVL